MAFCYLLLILSLIRKEQDCKCLVLQVLMRPLPKKNLRRKIVVVRMQMMMICSLVGDDKLWQQCVLDCRRHQFARHDVPQYILFVERDVAEKWVGTCERMEFGFQ